MGKSPCFGREEGAELLQFLEKSAGSAASSPAFHPGGVWGPPPASQPSWGAFPSGKVPRATGTGPFAGRNLNGTARVGREQELQNLLLNSVAFG